MRKEFIRDALIVFENTVSQVRQRGILDYHLPKEGSCDVSRDHTQRTRFLAFDFSTRFLPRDFRYQSKVIEKSTALELIDIAAIFHDVNYALGPNSSEIDSAYFSSDWMKTRGFPQWQIQMVAESILNTTLSPKVLDSQKRDQIVVQNPLAVILGASDVLSVFIPYTSDGFYSQNGFFLKECQKLTHPSPLSSIASYPSEWQSSQSNFFESQAKLYQRWFRENPVLVPSSKKFDKLIVDVLERNALNSRNARSWRAHLNTLC